MSAPPRVTFRPPGGPRPGDAARWTYLGWDPEGREREARARGSAPRPLGPALRETAARLRGPFLDLIAALGRGQQDEAAWWAGTLPWKSWSASDLFLLCCYRSLAEGFARAGEPLVVVVEDPWLRAQLGARKAPLGPRARALALGAARRARWALRMAASRLRSAASPAGRLPPPGAPAVLVHSYLIDRCLGPRGWEDPYFPGLEAELAAAGAAVVRSTDPDVTGFERRLAVDGVVPLMRRASAAGFLRALFSLPPGAPAGARLDGLDIELLLGREWWHDVSRAGRCAHLLLHDAAVRLLSERPWKALMLAWEGQPPERLLSLAARGRGVRVVGSQHTTVSPFQLPFLLGAGEAEWAPFPDALLTTGSRPRRILAEGGVPEARLRGGGSRRFRAPGPVEAAAPGSELLVVLPVDRLRTRHLLGALARAYPRGVHGTEVAVKPHPGDPGVAVVLPFPARIASEPLPEALARARAVLFTSTAAGLEALAAGRAALRYRPDPLLDVDPCDVLDDAALATTGDEGFKEALDGILRDPRRPAPAAITAAYAELFEPLDAAVWRRELLG